MGIAAVMLLSKDCIRWSIVRIEPCKSWAIISGTDINEIWASTSNGRSKIDLQAHKIQGIRTTADVDEILEWTGLDWLDQKHTLSNHPPKVYEWL